MVIIINTKCFQSGTIYNICFEIKMITIMSKERTKTGSHIPIITRRIHIESCIL